MTNPLVSDFQIIAFAQIWPGVTLAEKDKSSPLWKGIAQGLAMVLILPSTPVGQAIRNATIKECAEKIGDMCISEMGLFDAKHYGQRGRDRSDALHDACVAVSSLALSPSIEQKP